MVTGNPKRPEIAHKRLVKPALGVDRPAREEVDLDQRVTIAQAGRGDEAVRLRMVRSQSGVFSPSICAACTAAMIFSSSATVYRRRISIVVFAI